MPCPLHLHWAQGRVSARRCLRGPSDVCPLGHLAPCSPPLPTGTPCPAWRMVLTREGRGRGEGGACGATGRGIHNRASPPPFPSLGGLWIHNSAWNRPGRSPSRAPHRVTRRATHRVTHRVSALCRQAVGREEGGGRALGRCKGVLVGAYGWGRVHTKDLWSARHRASTAQHATCCRKWEDSAPHPTPYG
jgi:hypothetical protein